MDNLGLSVLFSIVIGVLIGLALSMLRITQQHFRNQIIAKLKESTGFTIIRLLSYVPFLTFFGSIALSITLFVYLNLYTWIPANSGFRVLLFFIEIVIITALAVLSVNWGRKISENSSNFIKPVDRPQLMIMNGENTEETRIIVKTFNKIYDLLDANLIHPFGKVKSVFTIPGGPYGHPYLWDSAFISHIWRIWDPKIARESLRVFLELQNDEGQCPQNVTYGKRPYYKITNPPLLAWALLAAAEMDDDYELLEKLYPRLSRFHRFLYEHRRKNGLFVWKHSYESGVDNSPRFTDRAEKVKYDIEHLWAVDFNSWIVLQNDCLAKIAEKLGYTEDQKYYIKRKEELKHLINKYLWDEKTGFYYDYDYQKKELNKIPTIASIIPMIAQIPGEDQAKILIEHIKNEFTFNTLIPFPTVARNYPDFAKDCWRGAVWINTAYIGVKSLQKYGINQLASELAFKVVMGIAQTYRNEGSIYEFYDPDNFNLDELTRKKGNLYKQITLGGKPVKNFVGWTGLANTLLIEDVLGIHFYKNELVLKPHLPEILLGTKIVVELPYFDKIIFIQSKNSKKIIAEVTSYSDVKSIKASEIYTGNNHEILVKKE
jgi:glycogen debranching enzyme